MCDCVRAKTLLACARVILREPRDMGAFADDLSWITGTQPAAPMNVNGWAGIYLDGQATTIGNGLSSAGWNPIGPLAAGDSVTAGNTFSTACSDITGDGVAELVISPDEGAGRGAACSTAGTTSPRSTTSSGSTTPSSAAGPGRRSGT